MEQHNDINSFIYRRCRYRGQVKPETLVFNANLQDFAQRVSYITALETAVKLSPQEYYHQTNALWEQIKRSYSASGLEDKALIDSKDLVGLMDWCIQDVIYQPLLGKNA